LDAATQFYRHHVLILGIWRKGYNDYFLSLQSIKSFKIHLIAFLFKSGSYSAAAITREISNGTHCGLTIRKHWPINVGYFYVMELLIKHSKKPKNYPDEKLAYLMYNVEFADY